jgi:deoxyribodipyrimidine photolyase-related protein
MSKLAKTSTRRLVLVLGDQLSLSNPAIAQADKALDLIMMAEVAQESTYVWSHKARTALFLSAMRHFAQTLLAAGYRLEYFTLGTHAFNTLAEVWGHALSRHQPESVVACEPGDWRVEQTLVSVCADAKLPLTLLPDTHFMISREAFAEWAGGNAAKTKQLRMELFYRTMRKRTNVLMRGDGSPEGEVWNFDAENRGSFGKLGPQNVPEPIQFPPDAITRDVFAAVERALPNHPGSLEHFAWPVTRDDALRALNAFIRDHLPAFGQFQDAMWTDEPFLHHSLLSTALNLKLLDPREVIDAAVNAYRQGHADLPSAEGFIRQILGWREFMRGVYWLDMPEMGRANHFNATTPLPKWYWTGDTNMNCMRQSITQTLSYGYAHHIQRLMVTGNFALIAGIVPQAVSEWYLAVYVDAVEWVQLPNTAGMALYANGGRFTSKPYAASGAYIKRMSNYCATCRYKPDVKAGPQACPMSTFYWDFLIRHEATLNRNPRAVLMMKNLARLDDDSRAAIRAQASRNIREMDSL